MSNVIKKSYIRADVKKIVRNHSTLMPNAWIVIRILCKTTAYKAFHPTNSVFTQTN